LVGNSEATRSTYLSWWLRCEQNQLHPERQDNKFGWLQTRATKTFLSFKHFDQPATIRICSPPR